MTRKEIAEIIELCNLHSIEWLSVDVSKDNLSYIVFASNMPAHFPELISTVKINRSRFWLQISKQKKANESN